MVLGRLEAILFQGLDVAGLVTAEFDDAGFVTISSRFVSRFDATSGSSTLLILLEAGEAILADQTQGVAQTLGAEPYGVPVKPPVYAVCLDQTTTVI